MTKDDLERIERQLKLVPPRSYRDFMQSGRFGEGYGGSQDLNGVADEIIEMNQKLRARGFFESPWPDSYLAIGDDGAGDYYFTDLQQERPAVFYADHELTTINHRLVLRDEYQSETFEEFWNSLKKSYEETNAALAAQRDSQGPKRWWQFFK